VLCFVIAAGFLLSLVPEPRRQTAATGPPPTRGRAAGTGRIEPGPL